MNKIQLNDNLMLIYFLFCMFFICLGSKAVAMRNISASEEIGADRWSISVWKLKKQEGSLAVPLHYAVVLEGTELRKSGGVFGFFTRKREDLVAVGYSFGMDRHTSEKKSAIIHKWHTSQCQAKYWGLSYPDNQHESKYDSLRSFIVTKSIIQNLSSKIESLESGYSRYFPIRGNHNCMTFVNWVLREAGILESSWERPSAFEGRLLSVQHPKIPKEICVEDLPLRPAVEWGPFLGINRLIAFVVED